MNGIGVDLPQLAVSLTGRIDERLAYPSGCTKISPGCRHWYAETFAERFRGVPGHPFEFGFDLRLVPEKLGNPIRWSKPKRIFVNSMSDLFHESVPDEYIEKVCRVMLAANWHTVPDSHQTRRPYDVVAARQELFRTFIANTHRYEQPYRPRPKTLKLLQHSPRLRLSYGDYVEQLTLLLFLKMADEQSRALSKRPPLLLDPIQMRPGPEEQRLTRNRR